MDKKYGVVIMGGMCCPDCGHLLDDDSKFKTHCSKCSQIVYIKENKGEDK
jgi:hypothetical protein